MAESMLGLKRTCRCAELNENNIGQTVTVMGWVAKQRNKGGLVFVDLRDRSGILQLIYEETECGPENFAKAEKMRAEFVVAAVGTVCKREAVNPNIATGAIEIRVKETRILSESETPPFHIVENSNTKEDLRLKYRSLDLRRPDMQRRLILRSQMIQNMREFMSGEGFLEIETPILCKSTPEGARDYLVPSRVHPGNFYALPQSPQLFKQLLMCSGFDRYFQIAKCFRDEDLRADRQPEFTQADMELSFVDVDDVIDVNERLIQYVAKKTFDLDVELPLPRMKWIDAMNNYGSDKPDTRFGMTLIDITEEVKGCDFAVFSDAAAMKNGSVRGINVKGQGGMARKKIDALVTFAKGYGAKGLPYIQLKEDGSVKCSFAKFMKEEEIQAIISKMNGEKGDLLLIAADQNKIVWNVLGALRLKLGEELGLIDHNKFNFLWVVEFPLLEWSDEEERFVAMHHPFTMPMDEDWHLIDSDPGAVRAKAYDIVLNGVELGGGSVRIHQNDIQEKMFEVIGLKPEEAQEKFGFLLTAFKYGVPPHAGLAYGVDRFVMLMTGAESIRDVMAFPKNKDAVDLMSEAPNYVDKKQLEELSIAINIKIIQGFQDPLIMIAASCLKNTVEICMESVLSHGLFAINSLKCLLHVYMLKVLM